MRTPEKFRSDIDKWSKNPSDMNRLREVICHNYKSLPAELIDDILCSFQNRIEREPVNIDSHMQWLNIVLSIFGCDWNGDKLTELDWKEVRDMADAQAEVMDMDTLSYVMGLVLENGGLKE